VEKIKEGNVPAGIELAGDLLALGFILRASIAGPSEGWANDLISFAFSGGYGTVLLLVLSWIADQVFLRNTTDKTRMEQNNHAAVVVKMAIKVGFAIVISVVI
jgi:uncharacterized membrane protein YjfL (UPF0719 family)